MSMEGSDQELNWARRHFFVDDHTATDTAVSEGHIQAGSGRKGSSFIRTKGSERKRHRRGTDEDDSTSDSRSEKRKVKRGAWAARRDSMLGGELGGVGRRKGKKMAQIDEGFMFDGDDSYGVNAKNKYGFLCTPVRCFWYLAEPRVLVCVHPVLGEMRASFPSVAAATETPDRWYFQEYSYDVMYDHDIYTIEDPNFDDDAYQNIEMFTWPQVIKVPSDINERDEESNDEDDDDNDDDNDDFDI